MYNGEKEGSLIAEHFKYSTTEFMDYGSAGIFPSPFVDVPPANPNTGQVYATSLQHCT